jgi:Helix-turn-helix domain
MTAVLEDHLRAKEAADALGKSLRALQDWRKRGYGPPYLRVGETIWYPKPALLDWLKNQEVTPCPK